MPATIRLPAGGSRHPTGMASRPSEAIEDYAKAIYSLCRQGDGTAGTNALAERLGVTPASVSAMVKKLDERGLVRHVRYKGVALTPAGERVALEVMRHHRLLETYLAEHLGVPWDRVHEEASSRLSDLEVGDRGRFVRVSDSDPAMLRYLAERGVALGDELEVLERQPFDGPLTVRFGDQLHVLGGTLARAMRVERGA